MTTTKEVEQFFGKAFAFVTAAARQNDPEGNRESCRRRRGWQNLSRRGRF